MNNNKIPYLTEGNVIEYLNKAYTSLVSEGKCFVLRMNKTPLGHAKIEFFTHKSFIESLRDMPKIKTGRGKETKYVNPAKIWLDSSESASAKIGLTFNPKAEKFIGGKLNTYMGLGCKPLDYVADDLNLYLDHVKKIICSNNEEHYEYVIKWIAHLVQKPEEKPEVAIVLKAGQGTGKGTFVKPLADIVKSHYLHATSPDAVLGRFNALLETKVLLFADEFFAGSKKSTDKLKGLITEESNSIERKGIDAIPTPCYMRIILATNHENVVRIEKDERRYCYLIVSDEQKQNHDYFAPLKKQINHKDFPGKFLKFLLDIDISDFNVRKAPKTKALTEQKIDNLDALDKWLYTCLDRGSISGVTWEARLDKEVINRAAESWLTAKNLNVFGEVTRKIGHLLPKIGAERIEKKINRKSVYFSEFKSLEESRELFEKYINADIDWS